MNFIAVFQFVASLVSFGLLWWLYDPLLQYLRYDVAIDTGMEWGFNLAFFLWALLTIVVFFGNSARLIMEYQKKKYM